MANIVNVTVDDTTDTISITINDGIITASGGGTFINGFLVNKGSGNTAATIEAGDYIAGWIGEVWQAGKVTTIPVNDVSDINDAVQGEIL